ncbi:zinc ribbon domain-containing protein [Flammeovirga yaeyamensis]|uniref:Zinc ribbon domain-containing protein n=1 Tax=Flammeovirga yaeyamensis TaxID=367791 RepID=A0AAX1NBA4_9BACT|nr:NUDIX hydrolase [Flammeovirga yaeyamensis]MBB3697900.1 ADP-ribose pyrophosphatase YjhB (NUDIX family) [Flammeovirga yaeyamensis]NMF35745.1 NUDIX hydrolase [Flammeovirga yaeyamensis]QWG03303.1 zinc ribbon domain-containing protein [Flammeovirga yaeyamensis]
MNFCSQCGSDQLQFIVPEGDHKQRFVCDNCGTIHYQNPRIIAGCLPVFEGKILLGKRAIDPRKGYWGLPAGFLENGETPEDGALRELFEETLAKGHIKHLQSVFSLPQFNQVYLIYLVDLVSDEVGPTSETLESKLFEVKDIPWEDIAFESTTFALEEYLKNPEAKMTKRGYFVWEKEKR